MDVIQLFILNNLVYTSLTKLLVTYQRSQGKKFAEIYFWITKRLSILNIWGLLQILPKDYKASSCEYSLIFVWLIKRLSKIVTDCRTVWVARVEVEIFLVQRSVEYFLVFWPCCGCSCPVPCLADQQCPLPLTDWSPPLETSRWLLWPSPNTTSPQWEIL